MNKLKYVRIQNEDGSYGEKIPFYVDGSTVEINGQSLATKINEINSSLANKVIKEQGKGLSSNDYTNEEKQKLSSIDAGATNTIIDSTLNTEGAAADALAVKEKINVEKNALQQAIDLQANHFDAEIAQLQSLVGSPLIASTVSAMTDHNKIYVYTGSESGYTNGNWYYWNDSSWTSGGVYNAVAIDIDAIPTQGSTNAVSSWGVWNALKLKVNTVNGIEPDASGNVSIPNGIIPASVKTAIFNLLNNGVYTDPDMGNDIAIIQSWTQEVSFLDIDKSSASITGSNTTQITATTIPANVPVSWASSDTGIATVNSNGLVTAVDNGTCVIMAQAGDLFKTCVITVSGVTRVYNVTYNLTDVTSSNDAVTATSGQSYVTTLTPVDAEAMDVIVKMRGVDITEDVYINGSVNITSVTGNIEITAYAKGLYPLTSGTFTFGTSGETIEISNGNHIKFTRPADAPDVSAGGSFANLYHLENNKPTSDNNASSVNSQGSTMFVVPNGATVSAEIVNITKSKAEIMSGSGQMICVLRRKKASTNLGDTFGYKNTGNNLVPASTVTSEEITVSCIAMYWQKFIKGQTVEFDIILKVNGTRWL